MKKQNIKYLFLPGVLIAVAIATLISGRTNPGPGMPYFRVEEDHVFIQYQKNKITFYGNKEGWNQLFGKMEQLLFSGEEHISMVHIGGSHVQAGRLTDRLRSNMESMAQGIAGERGLVFPFKLAGTNSPGSIHAQWTGKWTGCRCALSTDSCNWGLTGINATTVDSIASLKIWVSSFDSTNYDFREIKILTPPADSNSMQLTVVGAKEKFSREYTGYRTFQFAESQDTVLIQVTKTDSLQNHFILQGLYIGEKENGITYNAIGVNGASTKSYLRCSMFFEQFPLLQPDLVLFGIGVNDANVPNGEFDSALYERRYDSLITSMRAINPQIQFLFITNNDTYYQKKRPNQNAFEVQKVMIRLAEKYDGAVWDMFEIMGGLGSIKSWQNAGLAQGDKIHLTGQGYELQADMMYQAFIEAFGNYLDQKEAQ